MMKIAKKTMIKMVKKTTTKIVKKEKWQGSSRWLVSLGMRISKEGAQP